jgi:hypothetical protein
MQIQGISGARSNSADEREILGYVTRGVTATGMEKGGRI